jgi:putative hemolysin
MTTTFIFLVIVLLILANGFFVLSEMSIVSSRKSKLQQLADDGNIGAKTALNLSNTPSQFLLTTQLGITLIGILAGAFGVITIAKPLAVKFQEIPNIASYSEFISNAIVVLSIACLILILGEMTPKKIALSNPEKIASSAAPCLKILTHIVSPFVFIMDALTNLAIWIMGIRPSTELPLDEEEKSRRQNKRLWKESSSLEIDEPELL